MIRIQKWRRFQFQLRSLFIITTLIAVFFSIACAVGYIEASGTVAALLLLMGAFCCRSGPWVLIVRSAMVVSALGILWFAAVDRSVFYESCERCRIHRFVVQYRIYRMSILENAYNEHGAAICRIAEDLGAPCPHKYVRWHLERSWGFLYASPQESILCCLGNLDWYDEKTAQIVRARSRASPGLAQEFRQKVLYEQDMQYLGRFLQELK